MEPLRITFPGISPVLLSCWLLAFTLWLDDLVIGSLVTGFWQRLCRCIFSRVPRCVGPAVNALATLFFGVLFVVVSLALRLDGRAPMPNYRLIWLTLPAKAVSRSNTGSNVIRTICA